MKEKTLTKLSIIGTIVGILSLYIITSQIFSFSIDIGDIDKSFSGKTVNITGKITSISENNGNIFMNVMDDTGEIKVVLWEDTIKSMNENSMDKLKKGININIIGEVQIYKGEIEVIPMRGSVKIA